MPEFSLRVSRSLKFFRLAESLTINGELSLIDSRALETAELFLPLFSCELLRAIGDAQLEPAQLRDQELVLSNIRGGEIGTKLYTPPRENLLTVKGTVMLDERELPEEEEVPDELLSEEAKEIELPFSLSIFTTFHDFQKSTIRYRCLSEISGPIGPRIKGLLVRHLFSIDDLKISSIEFNCDIFKPRYLGASLGASPFVSRHLQISLTEGAARFSASFFDRRVSIDGDPIIEMLSTLADEIADTGIDSSLPGRLARELANYYPTSVSK